MDDEKENIVPFKPKAREKEDLVAEAVKESELVKINPNEQRNIVDSANEIPLRPVWPAIHTFTAIALLALIAAVSLPATTGGAVTWSAGVSFVIATLMGGAALLYRYAREYWR